ncbi:MAG: PAS domain S-box protein [Anaerolineales bacterium]
MIYPDIDPELLRAWQEQAQREGCTPNDLLQRWLRHPLPIDEELLDAAPSAIVLSDMRAQDAPVVYVNQAFIDMTGYPREEILGRNCRFLQNDDRDQPALATIRQALETGETCTVILRNYRKDGALFWNELHIAPVHNAQGELTHYIGIQHDVSARVQAEQVTHHQEDIMRRNEEQLRWLVQHMPVMVDAFNPQNHIIVWNQACEWVTGYTAEEIVGNPRAMELLYPDPAYLQMMMDDVQRLGHALYQHEYTLTTKTGEQRIVSWSHIPAPYRITGDTTWAIGIDVTDQRRAEDALRASERRYRMLTSMMSDYVASVAVAEDGELTVEWIDGAFSQITGHPVQIGYLPNFANIHPADRARVEDDLRRTTQGEPTYSEYRHLKPDGALQWLGVQRQPEWDATGTRVVRFYVVAHDITARKEAESFALENARLTQQFQREQAQNTLIQRIIAMLSHDMRTPLSVIAASREIIAHYADRMPPEKLQARLEIIGRQVALMDNILQDTVDMARNDLGAREFRPGLVNLATLCQVSVAEISLAAPTQHRLRFHNPGQVENARVDEVLVSRILLNLLSNALKYSPEPGDVRLELDREGPDVILRVIDNGVGIQAEDLPHIFEPFYRAAHTGEIRGMGLGLSIVQTAVARHHGHISVTSQPGQGSTFTVHLPGALTDVGSVS